MRRREIGEGRQEGREGGEGGEGGEGEKGEKEGGRERSQYLCMHICANHNRRIRVYQLY